MAGTYLSADLYFAEQITPWDVYKHGIERVLVHQKTKYQEMCIVKGAYGKALILDGKWQSCTEDEFLYHESLVHPPMIFHGSPRKVLVFGGAEGATIREVLRWKTVEKVVMVDIDGEVVELCKKYLPEMHQNVFEDPRVELIIDDAQNFLDSSSETWDVIISDLTDPIEEGPSFPLFTQEYFQKIRQVLSTDGFFIIQGGSISPAEMYLHVRVVKTLQSVFNYVHSFIPYSTSYGCPLGFVIASDKEFSPQVNPEKVDSLLAEKTIGDFQLMDGISLLGMSRSPLNLREAIAAETEIYTLKNPPKNIEVHG
ncbi:MAG: spermidine synthase [Okeania sp. SIO3I5]|uniref:spermine/spermidine synthase domain-containing protein n=1 Tax=Okeania sp. SIO3I5 TaxID=2607805 RepID=UPI0013B78138|nr:spermidine synthase [Okeania sp. SIO3I5]NEQ40457.1 spermidine synthase [Okeania sp. SIO3I5]